MLEWLGWATAAYENEKSSLASTMKVVPWLVCSFTAAVSVPQTEDFPRCRICV
jgi:hypothetical protein